MDEEYIKNELLNCEMCELILGTNVDVHVNKNECEIRADIVVEKKKSVRIWGQVITCEHQVVEDALVELVRVINKCECGKKLYEGIAHTYTDCKGFYQFDVCDYKGEVLKIIVGKPVVCRVIPLYDESESSEYEKEKL